jgi:hypothetical protein
MGSPQPAISPVKGIVKESAVNEVPVSMKDELQAWNCGKGIDLESWIGCSGSFALAVGYASIFCPEFIEFEDYILRYRDITQETVKRIREFESRKSSTPRSVEWC